MAVCAGLTTRPLSAKGYEKWQMDGQTYIYYYTSKVRKRETETETKTDRKTERKRQRESFRSKVFYNFTDANNAVNAIKTSTVGRANLLMMSKLSMHHPLQLFAAAAAVFAAAAAPAGV